MLRHQLIELALLDQLGHGADREAERSHGGAQSEGLLHGAGGAHFVVAQADAEATGFTVATVAVATLAGTPAATAFATKAIVLAGLLARLLARLLAGLEVTVGHGRTPEKSWGSVTHWRCRGPAPAEVMGFVAAGPCQDQQRQ